VSDKSGNFRELEDSIHTDLKGQMTYGKYLHLPQILNAQHRLSDQHDEMLFIVIHQASELWLKLAGHEVEAAIRNIRDDDFRHAFKVIARVKLILMQLTQSWSILSTMTPVDYLKFRDALGPASGFQSHCYRKLEFLLGNKNSEMIEVHRHEPEIYDELNCVLAEPGLYDVVLRKLSKIGFDIDGRLRAGGLAYDLQRSGDVFRTVRAGREAGGHRRRFPELALQAHVHGPKDYWQPHGHRWFFGRRVLEESD
jgi:tryptophan 2,3-dioxygenase